MIWSLLCGYALRTIQINAFLPSFIEFIFILAAPSFGFVFQTLPFWMWDLQGSLKGMINSNVFGYCIDWNELSRAKTQLLLQYSQHYNSSHIKLPQPIHYQIIYQLIQMAQTGNRLKTQTSILSNDEYTPEQIQKRTFFQRAFAPLNAGAMRGSIFALLASAMGCGMFNLPYRIDRIGIVPFIVYVLVAGLFSYIGMYLISRLIIRVKIHSYSEMCEKAYGKYFRKFAQFCIVFYPWGITICFQIIFAKFLMQIIDDVFKVGLYAENGRPFETYSDKGQTARIFIILGATLLNLLFILKKEIGVLQKISIIGVVAIIVNIGLIFITFFVGFTTKYKGTPIDYHGFIGINWAFINWFSTDGWESFSENMQSLSAIIFCFVNHQLVFPLVFDLKNPTKKRLDKVFNRVHQTQIIVYICVGLFAYLLLSEHIDRFPISNIVMGSIITSIMTLGKMFMVVALFFAVPLNLFPSREHVYECFGLQKNNRNHIILSVLLAFSGAAIAIFYEDVSNYFSILGGTAGVMMAGGIQAICYYKLKGPRTLNQKLLLIFMAVITVLGILGAILSVVSIFN